MLTDVFFRRYHGFRLKESFSPSDAAFLVQGHRLLVEQVFPHSVNGKKSDPAAAALKQIHDLLSMEIGLHELSPLHYSYISNGYPITGPWTYDLVLKEYMCEPFQKSYDVTSFLMQRISLLELGMRLRARQVAQTNIEHKQDVAKLSAINTATRTQSTKTSTVLSVLASHNEARLDALERENAIFNSVFESNVRELNVRFRQAGYPFHYHNDYVQISSDILTLDQVEKPFWDLVAGPLWANVDADMKEAIDRRDNNGRDPAFYAAKALESAIKILSDKTGATTGHEKGAHNYIDNLLSPRSGKLIEGWEAEALKALFSNNRNPLGHGPGSAPMPLLNAQQTDWVIENCMSWIKSLVRRQNP